MRRPMRILLVAVLALVPGLVACGSEAAGPPTSAAPSATQTVPVTPTSPTSPTSPTTVTPTSPTTVPTRPSSPSTPPTTAPATPPSQVLRVSAWSSEPLSVQHPTVPVARLVEVRSAHHTEGAMAYDRLVFEFTGSVPGYSVRYVTEVVSPGQGAVVPLRGQAFVEVVFYPAAAHNDNGVSTLRTSGSGGGLPALVQYRMSGDYEGYVHYGLGVDDRVAIRVMELANPYRVAVDIAS
ncbi:MULTISPECIES: AMIN-like domain-containing (lipo)protein [Pseudofrankia]|uniref:AMIN-like domain-containing (lipo)protein n=1 Tax=Pseudofrankia TaxID=2994363 RepID=UPI000234C185